MKTAMKTATNMSSVKATRKALIEGQYAVGDTVMTWDEMASIGQDAIESVCKAVEYIGYTTAPDCYGLRLTYVQSAYSQDLRDR